MVSTCSYGSSAGLLGGVSGGRGDVGGFGTTSFGAIVSAMDKLPMTKNYEANDVAV
jgi:hypothetical protein